ncbi:MAG TPA: peptide chain release factor 2 [bacterium]|nr:peptide chain release factor 2 [bacterium]
MFKAINERLNGQKKRMDDMVVYIDLPAKRRDLAVLQERMGQSDFWNDNLKAKEVIDKANLLKGWVEPADRIAEHIASLLELNEMSKDEAESSDIFRELSQEADKVEKELASLEFKKMLGGHLDRNNAILSINSGAGGTEAADWAEMLLRMYDRWAERRGFETEIIDILVGEEAGLKNVTMMVKGEYAYGYLKAERGVHRLVRISPFDSNKRRHTSFASVDVISEITEDVDVEIDEKDLRIDTYRAGGAGGQKVNKTDSAVRITHIPTGFVTQCQNERSQFQNKTVAMNVMRSKIYELRLQQQKDKYAKEYGEKMDIAWGSQIRSYVFQPYQMVKDLRTDVETSNVQDVMDGNIDMFIEAYLKTLKS